MKVEYWEEEFIRNSIKACEQKHHLQQVAFSTFHNCLTQICFTCNLCLTSLPELEQTKIKKNQSLKSFEQQPQKSEDLKKVKEILKEDKKELKKALDKMMSERPENWENYFWMIQNTIVLLIKKKKELLSNIEKEFGGGDETDRIA